MVMVSGAGGLQGKGGRSPPPKRGGWEGADAPAAPYKHRLAHDPGSRRFGFPGGRSGASGSWGLPQVAFGIGAPDGSQDPMGRGGRTAAGRAARSVTEGQLDSSGGCARRGGAKGCPRRVGVQIRLSQRLAPPIGEQKLCHVHPPKGKTPPWGRGWGWWYGVILRSRGGGRSAKSRRRR